MDGRNNNEFDAERAYGHISELAAHRRLAGSPGERKAQAYLRTTYGQLDLIFGEEDFRYSDIPLKVHLPLVSLCIATASLLTSLAYLWGTRLMMIPAIVLLGLLYLGFRWSNAHIWFARRGGRLVSKNFVGLIRASGEESEDRGLVILSAHYDSKSQTFPVVVRATLYVLGFCDALIWGLTALALAIAAFAGSDLLGNRVAFCLTLVPAILSLSLVFNFTGNRSHGALDNAAGEGIILEMARVLVERPLGGYDVMVNSFGCEEMGLCGSIQYLLRHEEELRKEYFPIYMINFDMPFTEKGRMYLNTGFEVPRRRTSPYLNGLAQEVAEERGRRLHTIYLPTGAAADHMPWVRRGLEATAFVSSATCVHTARDSIELVDRSALGSVGNVALEVLRRMDAEGRPADD